MFLRFTDSECVCEFSTDAGRVLGLITTTCSPGKWAYITKCGDNMGVTQITIHFTTGPYATANFQLISLE